MSQIKLTACERATLRAALHEAIASELQLVECHKQWIPGRKEKGIPKEDRAFIRRTRSFIARCERLLSKLSTAKALRPDAEDALAEFLARYRRRRIVPDREPMTRRRGREEKDA